ncbi:MAG: hypothetical protein PHS45_05195 [Bacilli bacterium]|nr:hypothetical protein [Bacilli bacterium]
MKSNTLEVTQWIDINETDMLDTNGSSLFHVYNERKNIMSIKKYFLVGTDEWKITVKWCVLIGACIGIITGISLLIYFL